MRSRACRTLPMGPKKGLEYGVTTTTTAVTMEIVLNGGVMVVVTVEVTQAGFHVAPSHEGAVEPAMTSVLRSIARAGVRSPEVPFRKQTPIKANVHVRREMVTKARMRVLIAMGGAILAGTIQNNHNGNGAGEASEARAIRVILEQSLECLPTSVAPISQGHRRQAGVRSSATIRRRRSSCRRYVPRLTMSPAPRTYPCRFRASRVSRTESDAQTLVAGGLRVIMSMTFAPGHLEDRAPSGRFGVDDSSSGSDRSRMASPSSRS